MKLGQRLLILLLFLFGGLSLAMLVFQVQEAEQPFFNAERAFEDIQYQVSLGPRTPGSVAHAQQLNWMQSGLEANGWQVERQQGAMLGHPLTNLVAKRGKGTSIIMLAAHYDSRIFADQDPDPAKQNLPVLGANDGASGVAVLLELSRVLPRDLDTEIWIVFFDLEDNGNLEGWDWILGSRYFAEQLEQYPDQMILVDMVGDSDLLLPVERSSDDELAAEIWGIAEQLGYGEVFRQEERYSILDDHIPFLELGIAAVDIIDIEYTNWHTSKDDLSQVSAESLDMVGSTLLEWILQNN